MKHSDATMLTAKLSAAFPLSRVGESTLALYSEEMARLGDVDVARETVQALVRTATRWPPLADLLATYRQIARRRQEERARARGLDVAAADAVTPGPERARAVLAALPAQGGPMTVAVRSFMEGIAGLPPSGHHDHDVPAADEAEANPGLCRECGKQVARRFTYGSFDLCRFCFDRRQRVAAALEQHSNAAAAPEPNRRESGGGERRNGQ